MRRHSSLVAAGIALSRVAGLLRDAVIAAFLGANVGADAFRAALRIPNLLQNLLGEGVLSASFIPTYSRLLHAGREREAGQVAGATAGLLTALTGVLVLLGVVFARPLTQLITPGFAGERLELTVTLVRIMTPGVGVLVLSAWCLGVLNSHRRFFLSYVAPVLWNAGIVATLIGFGATGLLDPAIALGWGVVLGGLLQFLVQVPAVRRLSRGNLRVSLDTRHRGVREVLRAFVPIVSGRGVVQLAAFLDLLVASFLAVGAVSVLGYAQALYLLPIGLFGMSVAAAELPALSVLRTEDRDTLRARLDGGLARSAFFVVGVTVAYLTLGDAIVRVLYTRGAFDAATATQVVAVLAIYSLGLVPATASRLLQSLLYGTNDARTPAVVAVLRVLTALAIAVPVMFSLDRLVVDPTATLGFAVAPGTELPAFSPVDEPLREAATNQFRLGALGIALGSAVGSWLEYALLRRTVAVRYTRPRLGGGTLRSLLLAAVAAVVVAALTRWLLGDVTAIVRLLGAGLPAGLTYLGVAAALRVREAQDLVRVVRPGR